MINEQFCKFSFYTQTFSNSHILTIVRALITGGEINELERVLAEGLGIVRKHSQQESQADRSRSRLALLPLEEGVLRDLKVTMLIHSLTLRSIWDSFQKCLSLSCRSSRVTNSLSLQADFRKCVKYNQLCEI